ncbi:mitochondrial 39-S ribosomal protein L47 (MRP-L47)-domain-containing protein [Mycena epipterygia]|nr:mitochondrial 39-S ribosomal protein L47 (MRP-L47)-domain-containing protein [Mycena epipterygia]
MMLSSALRAGKRISPRCLYFSTTSPAFSTDPAAPLLLGAPADHRSDSSYNSAPLAIGSATGSSSTTPETDTPADVLPPFVPQLSADHGLYGFFRRRADPNLRGDDQYETFADPTAFYSGRAWLASELRLKSFKDLHTLWYVLLRERNLLATQCEEMRRLGLMPDRHVTSRLLITKCRKSMARIKAVMNERRLAYEGALALAEKERETATDAAVLKFKVNAETTEQHRQRSKQLRKKVVKPRTRTARAGVKVQARKSNVKSNMAEPAAEAAKKPRWTKAQKLANAQHKQAPVKRPAKRKQQPVGGAQKSSPRRVHLA